MKTAANFLDDLRAKYDLASDYQVAGMLGLKRQQVSAYRTGKHTFDDNIATRVAELLDVPAAYVMACMAAQRAKSPALRKTWEKAAKTLAGTAVALLVGCSVLAAGHGAFDISTGIAHSISQVAESNNHYAHSAMVRDLLKLIVCAALLAWFRRIYSDRSQ